MHNHTATWYTHVDSKTLTTSADVKPSSPIIYKDLTGRSISQLDAITGHTQIPPIPNDGIGNPNIKPEYKKSKSDGWTCPILTNLEKKIDLTPNNVTFINLKLMKGIVFGEYIFNH